MNLSLRLLQAFSRRSPRPRLLLVACCLLVSTLESACSAEPMAPPSIGTAPLQPTERRSFDPGGPTLITQWTAPGEALPRVVQASGYRSGMRLIDGLSLVFHVQKQRWLLMLREGISLELEPAQPGERLQLAHPPVDAPVIWRAKFEQSGQDWSLAITQVQVPPPEIPGVSTEGQHALDLLLVRNLAGSIR